MSKRGNLVNEKTYGIVINRYAAAQRVEDAEEFFYKRKIFDLELDKLCFKKRIPEALEKNLKFEKGEGIKKNK